MCSSDLYLGPLAPDTAYNCQMFFYRSPKAMLKDDDVPEIPQQWRTALAKYGAAMACIADRDLQTAQALLQEYIYEKQDFDNYKDVDGIKFPFKYSFLWLDGRFTAEITDVKVNVPVEAAKLTKP